MSTDFKPMLAGKFPGDAKLKFPLYVQPKLDGIRCCIVNGKAVTRTLKPVPNASIRAVLERTAYDGDARLEGMDGELIVGLPTDPGCYRKTVSFVMSEDKVEATDAVDQWAFYVFDMWNRTTTFEDSIEYTQGQVADTGHWSWYPRRILAVDSTLIGSLDGLHAHEQRVVDAGHEGVILRGPYTLYKFGRGSATAGDLLKVKRFTDSEAVVIGVYEEMHNANEATTNALGRTERSSHQANKIGKGTLGGLIVRLLHDHAGFKAGTEFKIGTGFNATERAQMWRDQKNWIGVTVRFKHFEVGAKDKPRHPVYQGVRAPEDMPDGN